MTEMNLMPLGEQEYNELLLQAVAEIENARLTLSRQVSSTISGMHWNLGKLLFDKKIESKHGSGVVNRLSSDLKEQYPDMGLSPRNLWNMKRFYERYKDEEPKLLQAVAVLPWGHNLLLMDKGLDSAHIEFYAQEIISKGWSRDMLLHAVKGNYYENLLATPQSNNFSQTLPAPVAEYANEVFRSRYNLGFLGITEPVKELKLEHRLVKKITRFILELGKGFTFIGNQHILPFNGKEYKVDMLFFHRGLHRMIAIDLKVGEFKPEYVGKMNYYLTLLDRIEKAPDEEPSIGLILCAEKDHLDVEVALQDIGKPIGVAEYQYLLPKEELLKIVSSEMDKIDE
jgi:predicted nuclease of restriction endonuclease-like (RecB) superfamily